MATYKQRKRRARPPIENVDIVVRLEHIHEMFESAPLVAKLENAIRDTEMQLMEDIPSNWRHRAQMVQVSALMGAAAALGITETDTDAAKGPVLLHFVDSVGDYHVQCRVRWPRKLRGFFLVPQGADASTPLDVPDAWFIAVQNASNLNFPVGMHYWPEDLRTAAVWQLNEFVSYLREYFTPLLDIVRNEPYDAPLGMVGDANWVRLLEAVGEMEGPPQCAEYFSQ